MHTVFSSRWVRYFIPNIGTIIVVALMLMTYRAWAASNGPAAPDATPDTISPLARRCAFPLWYNLDHFLFR